MTRSRVVVWEAVQLARWGQTPTPLIRNLPLGLTHGGKQGRSHALSADYWGGHIRTRFETAWFYRHQGKLTQKFIPSINWHLLSTPHVPGNFFSWVSFPQMTVYPLCSGLWKGSTLHFKRLLRGHPGGQSAYGNFPSFWVIVWYRVVQCKVHKMARQKSWTLVAAALVAYRFGKVTQPLGIHFLICKMQTDQ